MEVTARFLELLLAGASPEDLDLVVAEAEVSGTTPEQLESCRARPMSGRDGPTVESR